MVHILEDSVKFSLSMGLPEQATQGIEKAKNFLNDTTNSTINNLKDITTKSITVVGESTEKANHVLSTGAKEAKQVLTQTVTDTANNVNKFTMTTVDTIHEQANNVKDSLLVTSSNIEQSLEQKLHQVEQLSNTISTEIERTITSFFTHQIDNIKIWIDAHPIISVPLKFLAWGVNHPIPGLVIFIVFILIFLQLFTVFNRLLQRGLLLTLAAPFKLVTPLFKWSFIPLRLLGQKSSSAFISGSQNSNDRLTNLLSRLEIIKQEQNSILEEISAIVAANK
ncbi:hypothetical protein NIES37_42160 [Tolypothrix tenuis PCC 7101]|uniref:Uncharacterized protein n=1 Tax=Tolypothrix tenuis PCC 7101 TaxID=231146 RepID=A0A1Z4N3C2_9CYAN|nr:hypothetical protein [Aulosira sp. FACHB-113]BAZ00227.1 hypothetical protein NIES37_42160 [Tolypothrix tenuis PCC 7101]BAZ75852.1 hypothetical protein NIES50_44430 [Aulosira laxa NIES-50]